MTNAILLAPFVMNGTLGFYEYFFIHPSKMGNLRLIYEVIAKSSCIILSGTPCMCSDSKLSGRFESIKNINLSFLVFTNTCTRYSVCYCTCIRSYMDTKQLGNLPNRQVRNCLSARTLYVGTNSHWC